MVGARVSFRLQGRSAERSLLGCEPSTMVTTKLDASPFGSREGGFRTL
jgi:hypothetical protein